MDEHPESDSVELLSVEVPSVDSPAESAEVQTAVTREGLDPRLVGLIVLGVLVVAVLLFRPASGSDGPLDESAFEPLPESSLNQDEPDTSTTVQLGGATVGRPGASAMTHLSQVGLRAVITSPSHGDSVMLSIDEAGRELIVEEVPALSQFAFDSSGQWLAGVSTTETEPQRDVLWAGPVGGDFEPLAVGVSSFVWHDSRSATLAWSDGDEGQITTVELPNGEPNRVADSLVSGQVNGWGDWGFAVLTSRPDFTTSVLGPSGEIVAEDLPGRFNGNIPGSGLVLSGSLSLGPLVVDPETGASANVPWLGSDDYVWALAVAGDRAVAAALVARTGFRAHLTSAELTAVDAVAGESGEPLLIAESFTDLVLTADGEWIILAQQQAPNSDALAEILAVNRSGDSTMRLAVPDIFDGREWVTAITVG